MELLCENRLSLLYLAKPEIAFRIDSNPTRCVWETAQKMNFLLRISSVNVTKSAVSCGFGHIYWRNSSWKTSFFVQCCKRLQHWFWNNRKPTIKLLIFIFFDEIIFCVCACNGSNWFRKIWINGPPLICYRKNSALVALLSLSTNYNFVCT